jgi:hypothetical protein
MSIERRKAPGAAWNTVDASETGTQPFVSETGTTDPNTFEVIETFEVGVPGLVVLTMTVLALDGDGETWGDGVGEIGVFLDTKISVDGITWTGGQALVYDRDLDIGGQASVVGQHSSSIYATFRYGQGIASVYNFDSTPYVGANHPTAEVQFDYSVLTIGSTLT